MGTIYAASWVREIPKWSERRYWGGLLSPIQPTPVGTIDFSSVIRISDAYHIDRMGSGGHFVCFDICFHEDKSLHFEYSVMSSLFTEQEAKDSGSTFLDVRDYSISERKALSGYNVKGDLKYLTEYMINPLIVLWECIKVIQLEMKPTNNGQPIRPLPEENKQTYN